MAETQMLNMNSESESLESGPKMEVQKTSVTDNANENSDSFVIEMEAFSCASSTNKDSNSNSRITLQRSVLRKGRTDKMNVLHDRDIIPAACSPSPRVCEMFVVGCFAGSAPEIVVGSGNNCGGPRVNHQITVTKATVSGEAKSMARRNSFKCPSNNWGLDPRKVLIFFATVSSIGSILLLYITFLMGYH